MQNVRIIDNGAGFGITVNGLMVAHFQTLGGAWDHIKWMYEVASQQFTVGKEEVPVIDWIETMKNVGVWR